MAREALKGLGLQRGELSILLVDDCEMTSLNREFMGRDGTTDVLSFPMQSEDFGDEIPCILGDVVISVEKAYKEAKKKVVSLESELALLLTHGILHLVGFEHDKDEDELLMKREEERLLSIMNDKKLIA